MNSVEETKTTTASLRVHSPPKVKGYVYLLKDAHPDVVREMWERRAFGLQNPASSEFSVSVRFSDGDYEERPCQVPPSQHEQDRIYGMLSRASFQRIADEDND